ncbi:MAG: substrate-binding domain-containing protein [Chthoniobacterales bacterium]
MRKRIAVVITDIFLRRLTPALFPYVRSGQDFWIIDIDRPARELKRLLREMKPAGILTEELPGKTKAILELDLPTVVSGTDESHPGAVCLDVDDREIGKKAAVFFHQNGFRQFAFLGNKSQYSRQRGEGFIKELKHLGFDCASHTDSEKKGRSYMEYYRGRAPLLKKWLRALPRPVSIFAAHDPLGRLVCEVSLECGFSVPEDIAVVGVNDDELLCNLSYPPLSSVAIPWAEIGRRAVEQLEHLITRGSNAGKTFRVPPGDVVARESSDFTAHSDPLLRRALVLFRKRFEQPVTVGDLCRELHVNRRTLEKSFRIFLKRTPRQELERLRVARAQVFLSRSSYKMDWIAQRCGFRDAERLTVTFRKATKETPSHYRKRLRGH